MADPLAEQRSPQLVQQVTPTQPLAPNPAGGGTVVHLGDRGRGGRRGGVRRPGLVAGVPRPPGQRRRTEELRRAVLRRTTPDSSRFHSPPRFFSHR